MSNHPVEVAETVMDDRQMGRTLPPPLMTSEPESFARHTVLERLPRIVQRVIDDNDYPPQIGRALKMLQEELHGASLRLLREEAADVAYWNREVALRADRTWLEIEWYFAETYFYRRLLEAAHYFQPGPWQGHDPFERRKREQEPRAVDMLAHGWPDMDDGTPEDALMILLQASLWGNRGDLSYEAVAAAARAGLDVEQDRHLLLIDHAREVADLLTRGMSRVDLICDNVGMELLTDLALADLLMEQGWASTVVFHLKDRPFFVSDGMVRDVLTQICALHASSSQAMQRLGESLEWHLGHGRLLLFDDGNVRELGQPFWTSSREFREMPRELRSDLEAADLIILKGDANYRRLVGDRHWPHTARMDHITDHFPKPFLTLRTLKSELMVGLEPGQAERVAAEDADWLVNGQRGIIQLVEERT